MNYEELTEISMQIIANAGMSRSSSIEALKFARKGDFEEAEKKLQEAEKFYYESHEYQTNLIIKETSEEQALSLNLILVHAQDHLTMALISIDNAKELIELYKRIEELKC